MAQVIPEWPEVLCLFACDPRLTLGKKNINIDKPNHH